PSTVSETTAVGCAAALIQSVSKAQRRPKLVQVVFNMAALAIAIGVSFWGSHFVLAAVHTDSLTVLLALAACLFFLTNTGLVTTVISLVEERPFWKVWQQCHAWAFPYYLVGDALARLVVACVVTASWTDD